MLVDCSTQVITGGANISLPIDVNGSVPIQNFRKLPRKHFHINLEMRPRDSGISAFAVFRCVTACRVRCLKAKGLRNQEVLRTHKQQ